MQIAVLIAVPARQIQARIAGTPITLATAPVDPFDKLSGHYITLSYEVERDCLAEQDSGLQAGDEVWLTVQHGATAWTCVSVTREKPAPASGFASLRATLRYRWNPSRRAESNFAAIEGARRFYIPESRREAIAKAMREVRNRALVDLRVGDDGSVAIVRVRAGSLVLED